MRDWVDETWKVVVLYFERREGDYCAVHQKRPEKDGLERIYLRAGLGIFCGFCRTDYARSESIYQQETK